MTIKQCDRCGKTIDNGTEFPNEYRRYAIVDRDNSNVNVRSIMEAQRSMTHLDLCSECYNKLLGFIKNEDVSRSYRISQGGC